MPERIGICIFQLEDCQTHEEKKQIQDQNSFYDCFFSIIHFY
jgi:hypothetical protein